MKKLLLLLVLYSSSIYADNYDKYCKNPETEQIRMVCLYSEKEGIDPLIAFSGVIFASWELIGLYCNFSLSKRYFDITLPILNKAGGKEAKDFFMNLYLDNNLPPPGYSGNDKSFCKFNYDLLGPKSKEGIYL